MSDACAILNIGDVYIQENGIIRRQSDGHIVCRLREAIADHENAPALEARAQDAERQLAVLAGEVATAEAQIRRLRAALEGCLPDDGSVGPYAEDEARCVLTETAPAGEEVNP